MLENLHGISDAQLTEWVNAHQHSNAFALSAGYQGKTLLFNENNHRLVIKVPLGNFITRPINLALLRHEYKVYQKLQGVDFIPQCYGMANNEFLVIEFIEGKSIREKNLPTDSPCFVKLLAIIKEMHERQVAHFDLKRSENLMISEKGEPVLIDFGVSIIRKKGLHWLNHYLFNLAKQFDFNAWARHKYKKQMHLISEEDKPYYRKTGIEVFSKKIKRFYKDKFISLFKTHKK